MKQSWRKLLSILLAICMFITILPATVAAESQFPFTDVKEDTWYYESVKYVYDNGLMVGVAEDTFAPGSTLTRAMLVTVLWRMSGAPAAGESNFKDVPKGTWYSTAVAWAEENSIVMGYNGETFGPNDKITREQMAAMFYRYAGFIGVSTTESTELTAFTDATSTSGWAQTAMKWAVEIGLIKGTGNQTLSPTGNATRAQVAAILMRFDLSLFVGDYRIDFVSNGGNNVASQYVNKGDTVSIPENPVREGYAFVGWYTEAEFAQLFDFTEPVTSSITLYARWVDISDTTDTDGDGLTNPVEEYFGTNTTLADSDGDGLNDYIEIAVLYYDPLSIDTDNNGVLDGEEDADDDFLKNAEEVSLGTNPALPDTDGDLLSDYDELKMYDTDPLKEDTDEDGANDGWEVSKGFDPLTFNLSFEVEVKAEDPEGRVTAGVSLNAPGKQASSLRVEEVPDTSDPLLTSNIPGYLGSAFEFSADGNISSATITFEYSDTFGPLSGSFQPRIFYFDEENGTLEELENQTVADGRVSATVTHFSKYILLNKCDFDAVWEADIKPPLSGDGGEEATIDIMFVIDYSASMSWNDPKELFKPLSEAFIGKLRYGKDKAGAVKFIRTATLLSSLTTDKDAVVAAINGIEYDDGYGTYSGTNGSAGIKEAIDEFQLSNAKYKYMVFITDGEDTYNTYSYESLIADANRSEITIFTIGMGTANEELLLNIATQTGGKYYHATAEDEVDDLINLGDVFADIESDTVDLTADMNHDGIPDYYNDLIKDGTLVLSNGSKQFSGIDFNYDKHGNLSNDYDGDGVKNGDEIKIIHSGNEVYLAMRMNPTMPDTDCDGINDGSDTNPLVWDVSDRDLAMCASICYSYIPYGSAISSFSNSLKAEIENRFSHVATIKEVGRWTIADTWYGGAGLQAVAFKIDNNIIVAYRGSDETFDWINNATTYLLGLSTHTPGAKKFIKGVMNSYKGYNIYVTGHSLGGHLAYNAAAEAIHKDVDSVKGIVCFNGLGLTLGLTLINDAWDEAQLVRKESVIRNYSVEKDPVSQGFLGFTTFHYGTTIVYEISKSAPNAHSLYTFLEKLEPTSRFHAYQ